MGKGNYEGRHTPETGPRMINPKSPQYREALMNHEAKCSWPECKCEVPYYAFSGHNRVDYCEKLKAYEINLPTNT